MLRKPIKKNIRNSQPEGTTLEELADSFNKACKLKKLSEETIKYYCYRQEILFSYMDKQTLCKDVTWDEVQDSILDYGEGKATSSVNLYIRAIRALLYYGMEKGWIEEFPVTCVKEDEVIKEGYTDEEMQKLLKRPFRNASFAEWRGWLLANYFYGTGNRLSTVKDIQMKHLDLQGGFVTLVHQKNRKPQIIPLSASLVNAITLYINMWRKDAGPEEYLFCNRYGEKPPRRTIEDAVLHYNRSRGVQRTGCHAFRHAFARNWIVNGGSVFGLQKMLNHSTLEMVKKYVELYSREVQAENNRVNPLDSMSTKVYRIGIKKTEKK